MAETFYKDRRILITGASGFVGGHLVDRLIDLGAIIGITELDNSVYSDFHYLVNLCNIDDVNRAVSRLQPEIVFHLAAQPIVDIALNAPFDTLETNIRGTYNLLEVCSRVGKNIQSFVHFSTDKVYGETIENEGSTELSHLGGVTHPYNASKLCGDILAQSYASFSDLPISIIRSGNIYGEGDIHWDRLIPYVCKMLVTHQPIELRSDGFLYRDYIYVQDVIDALLLVGSAEISSPPPFPRIYNLGSEKSYTVKEIIQKIRKISEIEDMSIPIYKANTHLELRYQHMNYGKIKKELGWSPKINIEEGLKRTYEWYNTQYSD